MQQQVVKSALYYSLTCKTTFTGGNFKSSFYLVLYRCSVSWANSVQVCLKQRLNFLRLQIDDLRIALKQPCKTFPRLMSFNDFLNTHTHTHCHPLSIYPSRPVQSYLGSRGWMYFVFHKQFLHVVLDVREIKRQGF